MIRLEYIDYLNYLWVIPALLFLFIWFRLWKRQTLRNYGEFLIISRLMPEISGAKQWLKFITLIVALVFLIIGIANPQVGSKLEKTEQKGVDIIIALDVSNSMLAEDIKPNRIERARQAVSRFIDRLGNDRIGLIVFAGKAYPMLPLTSDYSAAKMFLSNADNSVVSTQGTSIADAIDLAIQSIPQGKQGKALIIITDGEDHEGEVMKKVEEAVSKGIVIHTIGIGSPQGVPIPLYRNNVRVGFRTGNDGQTVITKLNEPMLQQIAHSGQGAYVLASNSQFGLSSIYEKINKMEKGEFEDSRAFAEFDSRFYYFLFVALILLVFETLVYDRSSRWIRKLSRFVPVVLILMSFNANAQNENPSIRRGNKAYNNEKYQDAELQYRKALEKNQNSFKSNFNLGNSIYRQENYEEAGYAFQRAIANQTDKNEMSRSFYNYGNSLLKNQQIPESIEAYKNALRLNPSDDDARYNLAYALNLLQQQEQQQQQQGDKSDQNDEDQDKQDQSQQDQQEESQDQQQQESPSPQQISKQEAERMLQALKEDEEKTLEKINQQKVKLQTIKVEKDW
ncbi:MAG: VWA domain-containing protein [Bacteroidales bacterium]